MFPPEQKVDFGQQQNLVPDKMQVMIDSGIQDFAVKGLFQAQHQALWMQKCVDSVPDIG